ncbi:MAG: hypothetical protein GQ565_12380 [Candidatus Aegiribacteria sp.]|nr:hypothetical protein [Candidatus Aegiribacteria sp.]
MSKRIFDREYFRKYGQFLVGIEGVSGLLARLGSRELDGGKSSFLLLIASL